MVEVGLDELPAPLVAVIHQAKLECAYHLPERDRYVVELVLPSGQRQELEYDVALGRCLTAEERRTELPPARRDVLADEHLTMVTSHSIDAETSEKVVTSATDDGTVSVARAVHVPLVWDGARLIRDALRRQRCEMLAEILTLVGRLEQTPAAQAIAAFASRTGIAVGP